MIHLHKLCEWMGKLFYAVLTDIRSAAEPKARAVFEMSPKNKRSVTESSSRPKTRPSR
jgi:hypothetical protein